MYLRCTILPRITSWAWPLTSFGIVGVVAWCLFTLAAAPGRSRAAPAAVS